MGISLGSIGQTDKLAFVPLFIVCLYSGQTGCAGPHTEKKIHAGWTRKGAAIGKRGFQKQI